MLSGAEAVKRGNTFNELVAQKNACPFQAGASCVVRSLSLGHQHETDADGQRGSAEREQRANNPAARIWISALDQLNDVNHRVTPFSSERSLPDIDRRCMSDKMTN
jgi:hypothetical protein